jgi:hypothetical protein
MREVLGNDPKVREPNAIQPACIEAMKVVAAQKIELFGAAGTWPTWPTRPGWYSVWATVSTTS